MPIDIEQLRSLIKLAASVPGEDKGSQAMAAAAQVAKPAGGIPLPKPVKEEENPAGDALSAEQQQMEAEKLEQQRRKEIEAKENEIRGLKHELELEQVERQKAQAQHDIDMNMRQESEKLKAEKEKLDKEKSQLAEAKARQDNMFRAEEMKHQAELDKATYKQEAEIAKQQAKATADLAKQQAQSYIKTTDQVRKASDKYYADANNRLSQNRPAISPALQHQLDGAIATLDKFKQVHKKQVAIPRPGTPPMSKLAMVKWAAPTDEELGMAELNRRNAVDAKKTLSSDYGVSSIGGATAAMQGAARLKNLRDKAVAENNQSNIKYYGDMYNRARAQADANLSRSQALAAKNVSAKQDVADYKSYTNKRTQWNGFNTHKDFSTYESQFDRDANAYADSRKADAYAKKPWYSKALPAAGDFFVSPFSAARNSMANAVASSENAGFYGANRFWNTTFDDNRLAGAYRNSLQRNSYSDSPIKDGVSVLGNTALAGVDAYTNLAMLGLAPFTGGLSLAGGTAAKAALRLPKFVKWLGTHGGMVGGSMFLEPDELGPGGEFNFYKSGSFIPMPGNPPKMLEKKATQQEAPGHQMAAQAMNTGYDWMGFNNPWYTGTANGWLEGAARWVSPYISAMTNNMINITPSVGRHDTWRRPGSIIPATRMAQNFIEDIPADGAGSNMHRTVAQQAVQKHYPGAIKNYNGSTSLGHASARASDLNHLINSFA